MPPINFNPNLPKNDSLSPKEIEQKVSDRNSKTRELAEKAYLTSDVPVSAAQAAAEHSSIQRETAQAKKARRDANTWWGASQDD